MKVYLKGVHFCYYKNIFYVLLFDLTEVLVSEKYSFFNSFTD